MIYIGMKPAESTLEELQRELDIAYQKRKQEQASRLLQHRNAKTAVLSTLSPENRVPSLLFRPLTYVSDRSRDRAVLLVTYCEEASYCRTRQTSHAATPAVKWFFERFVGRQSTFVGCPKDGWLEVLP